MSVLTPHVFEPGDRVKAVATQGWLELDTVGLVTTIVKPTEPGALLDEPEDNIIVAWPRHAFEDSSTIESWNGEVEGLGSVDLSQFTGGIELPMLRREITFIDNLLKKD